MHDAVSLPLNPANVEETINGPDGEKWREAIGPSTSDRLYQLFKEICVDFKGYFPVAAIGKYRGFILFANQATNFV